MTSSLAELDQVGSAVARKERGCMMRLVMSRWFFGWGKGEFTLRYSLRKKYNEDRSFGKHSEFKECAGFRTA